MPNNMPDNKAYENISEWLNIYHSTDSLRKKAKMKTLIVATMIPVVKHLARTIARRATDPVDDMIQAGFIGLLKAIEKYSKERNDNFRVYAGYLIIGEMKHFLRDKLNMIRVPRHIQELTIRINNFTKNLTVEELQELTSDDVASALQIPSDAVDFALQMDRRRSTLSLDEVFINDNENMGYEEVIAAKDYKEQAEFEDAKIIFDDVIEKLPPEEKVLIDMYYKQDMTKREIAAALMLTPMSVSRRMKSAFNIISEFVAERQRQNMEEQKKNEDDE